MTNEEIENTVIWLQSRVPSEIKHSGCVSAKVGKEAISLISHLFSELVAANQRERKYRTLLIRSAAIRAGNSGLPAPKPWYAAIGLEGYIDSDGGNHTKCTDSCHFETKADAEAAIKKFIDNAVAALAAKDEAK